MSIRHAVPTVFQEREFAVAGGLLSYGAALRKHTAWPAIILGASSKATSPPTCRSSRSLKWSCIINLKTAKALGITVPLPLSGRADEVIE